ncbi:MAG TPA: DNA glycosylase [Nitrososphaeraceae archaeon]|nr:DNA glycosylase [Nitrososphaeraceae archaeon]
MMPPNFEMSINSGQMFLWEKFNNTWYGVYGDHILKFDTPNYNRQYAMITSKNDEDTLKLLSFPEFKNCERHIFRLDDNVRNILSSLSKDRVVSEAIIKYPGLRVMRQDPHQCIFSFVCSSNTNISMIRRMLKNLSRKFGNKMLIDGKEFYTFPSAESVNRATIGELLSCGLGYRAKAVKSVAQSIASGILDINLLLRDRYEVAKQELMKIYGVGNKIADCILLFSLEKLEAFPIDVWISRAIFRHYNWLLNNNNEEQDIKENMLTGGKITPYQYKILSEAIRDYFGRYSGYAQQYLFYDIRHSAGKKW